MVERANLLYLDQSVLEDSEQWSKDATTFKQACSEVIKIRYDDSTVFNLFNKKQQEVINNYFKTYSRYQYVAGILKEEGAVKNTEKGSTANDKDGNDLATLEAVYASMNEKVKLEINKRDTVVKTQMAELSKQLGFDVGSVQWKYDNYSVVDSDKNNWLHCDLCSNEKKIRNVHMAINDKNHLCLCFGQNCAAKFFAMGESSLTALKSLNSKLVLDLKYIALVMDEKAKGNSQIESDYYTYYCGTVGKTILDNGIQGIEDMRVFKVQWQDNNGESSLVKTDKGYPIQYSSDIKEGEETFVTLEWLKDHIVFCLNADLDQDSFVDVRFRNIIKKDFKKDVVDEINLMISFAKDFVNIGLPIPMSICKRLNNLIKRTITTHNPDMRKYALQELQMAERLKDSPLLTTIFTDFMVNYTMAQMNQVSRDTEMSEVWNIKTNRSFYNAVVQWEGAVSYSRWIKDFLKLEDEGYIVPNSLRPRVRVNLPYDEDINYSEFVKSFNQLIFSKNPVKLDNSRMQQGMSRYYCEGETVNLTTERFSHNYNKLYIKDVPVFMSRAYTAYTQGCTTMLEEETMAVKAVMQQLGDANLSVEDTVKALVVMQLKQDNLKEIRYYGLRNYVKNVLNQFNATYKPLVKEIVDKSADEVKAFKEDCVKTAEELNAILSKMHELVADDVYKRSNIKTDYEKRFKAISQAVKEGKKPKDLTAYAHFKQYCSMLVGKRASEKVQNLLNGTGLNPLVAFKSVYKHIDLFKQIVQGTQEKLYKDAISGVYTYYRLDDLYDDFKSIADNEDLFMKYIIESLCKRLNCTAPTRQLYPMELIADERGRVSLAASVDMDETMFESYKNAISDSGLLTELLNNIKEMIKPLENEITTEKELLSWIDVKVPEKELRNMSKASDFQDILSKYGKGIDKYSSTRLTFYDVIDTISCSKTEVIKENIQGIERIISEVYAKKGAEIDARKKKEDLVEYIKERSDKFINLIEMPVTAAMRKAAGRGVSDETIRRKTIFGNSDYESGITLLKHFADCLKAKGIATEYADKSIDAYNKNITDNAKISQLDLVLRAALYNNNFVLNHVASITPVILKALKTMDLYELTVEELEEIKAKLSVYFLLYNDMETICNIYNKYATNKIDLNALWSSLPKPEEVDLVKTYNAVDRAKEAVGHTDWQTKVADVDAFTAKIVSTVATKGTCSFKQLKYVDKACVMVGIDNAAATDSDSGSNTVQTAGVVNDTTTANQEDGVVLATAIKAHADFDTLSAKHQGIVNSTIAKNSATDKMLWNLKQAAKQLGITV